MTTLWSGSIPVDALDIVNDRLARIVRRAERLSFPVPRLVEGERRFKDMTDAGVSVQEVDISIEADGTLSLGDWEFVGVVSTLEDGSPYVTYAPGVVRPNFVVTHPKACDHCQSNRNRTDTYLVQKQPVLGRFPSSNLQDDDYLTPEVKQVGSSCIKDFTGHDPAAIVAYLDAERDFQFSDDEIAGWYSAGTRFYSPTEVLTLAARVVATAGYVNKQKAMDENRESTGDIVRGFMSARGTRLREYSDDYPGTEASTALYHAARQAIMKPANNDWHRDVQQLFQTTGIQWRHVGILASGVILGLREQENKVTEGKPASNFLPGEAGERVEVTATISLIRQFEGDYGPRFLIRFDHQADEKTYDLLWWASWSEAVVALNEGDKVTIRGTIKNHELDRRTERPTTVLTRCNIKVEV